MRHRIWALVLVLLLVFPSTRSAGVEPIDRTSVIKQAERHLLAMFGLEARPTPSRSNKTISNYVKELYERQKKSSSPDTIRCFKGRGKLFFFLCLVVTVKFTFSVVIIRDDGVCL